MASTTGLVQNKNESLITHEASYHLTYTLTLTLDIKDFYTPLVIISDHFLERTQRSFCFILRIHWHPVSRNFRSVFQGWPEGHFASQLKAAVFRWSWREAPDSARII